MGHMHLLVLSGCVTPSVTPSLTPRGPDQLNGRLVPGTDLCEYEVVAPDFPPPSEDESWLVDGLNSPYVDCADGTLSVVRSEYWGDTGVWHSFYADLQLFEVLVGATGSWIRGEVLDPLDGLDDCSLTILERTDIGVSSGEAVWLDSPEVLLESGSWSRQLEDPSPGPRQNGESRTYLVSVEEVAQMPPDAATFDLTVAAGTAPELQLEGLLTMPSTLAVTEPALAWGTTLPRADTTFRWTGVSDGQPVQIRLYSRTEFNGQDYPRYEIVCEVEDDGEFVLPGTLLTQLPAGWSAEVEVIRIRTEWMGTVAGRALRAFSAARVAGPGAVWGD
jgi:hypothetical protein